MSLSRTKLKNKILDIFTIKRMEPDPNADPPNSTLREVSPTMIIFAKELADAYDDYAQDSETYAGNKLVSTGKSTMQSLLETLDVTGNTGAFVSTVISSAIHAYWATAVYAVAPFPPGFSVVFTVVTTPPSSPSAPGLEAAMLAGVSAEVQADLWATAMHTQTQSVKTTHTGLDTTVPTPLPKTEADRPIS